MYQGDHNDIVDQHVIHLDEEPRLFGRIDMPSRQTFELALLDEVVQRPMQRPRFHCKMVFEAAHAPFKGFNRAQAAVIEAAILASRLHMLPREKIERELGYLQIAVEKTAGPREHEAWRLLVEKIEDYFKHAHEPR